MTERARGEAWSLAFARRDGTGGFVRLTRWPDRAWFWTYVVSPAWGLVVVRDHDVAPPATVGSGVVRADALWAELRSGSPDEHWAVTLEAFGVHLDDPLESERGERGERRPVGLDVEWEAGAAPFGTVHGELLVGDERADFDGTGTFVHESLADDAWDHAWRRLSWQGDGESGHRVSGDALGLELDAAGLPVAARVGSFDFTVAAVAVVPVGARLVLALLTGDAGWGWLEWCQPAAGEPGRIEDR